MALFVFFFGFEWSSLPAFNLCGLAICFLAGLLWCAVVLVAAARSALPAAAHMKMTNTGATGESRPLLPGFAMETPSALAVSFEVSLAPNSRRRL